MLFDFFSIYSGLTGLMELKDITGSLLTIFSSDSKDSLEIWFLSSLILAIVFYLDFFSLLDDIEFF